MSNSNGGKFFLGALIGVAAGAIAGVLFAPKSGKETRKEISDKAREYVVKGKEYASKSEKVVKGAIKETAEKVADKMS